MRINLTAMIDLLDNAGQQALYDALSDASSREFGYVCKARDAGASFEEIDYHRNRMIELADAAKYVDGIMDGGCI